MKKCDFFSGFSSAAIHSTASFAASSRQLAHQLLQTNWFAPGGKSNCRFSSEESRRTQLLRMIFYMGTVYYLNKLQVTTHPSSLQCCNCISTCSRDGLGYTCGKRAWQRQVAAPRFIVSAPDGSLCHCQAHPFNNVFTVRCCEDALACN